MKVCKQTDPEKGLTPVNRNVKDLRMARLYGSTSVGVVDWEGTSTRTLYHVRLLEVRLPLGSMARRYSES